MHAAIVKLDALPDAIGAATKNHDLLAVGRLGLALFIVGRIQVGGLGSELGSAGVHPFVDRPHVQRMTQRTHRVLVGAYQLGDAPIRKALALEQAQFVGAQAFQRACGDGFLDLDELLDLRKEPGVDGGFLEHLVKAHANAKCVAHIQNAFRACLADFLDDLIPVCAALAQAVDAGLEAAQRLLKTFLEGAAHRHHLAHGLHLSGEVGIGRREFLERKTRNLRDHVVDAGLEAHRRGATGDVVTQFIKRVAHRQLGGHLGDRKSGGLGRQGR